MKAFTEKSEGLQRKKNEDVSLKIQIYYFILWEYFCQCLLRKNSDVVFLRQSPPNESLPSQQLVLTAPLLNPWGRSGKESAGKGILLQPRTAALLQGVPRKYRNSWILPLSCRHRGSGHTCVQQAQLGLPLSPTDLYTNLSRMILFSLKCSINHPNTKYPACYFTI